MQRIRISGRTEEPEFVEVRPPRATERDWPGSEGKLAERTYAGMILLRMAKRTKSVCERRPSLRIRLDR